MVTVNTDGVLSFLEKEAFYEKAENALSMLLDGTGAGSEYLGWVNLPFNYDKTEFEKVKKCASRLIEEAEALVVIGVGGSYLGARAAIEYLLTRDYNEISRKGPKIYFIGNSLSGEEINRIFKLIDGKSTYVNVVSKSGNTLEPALAFRVFRQYMENRYGKDEARKRIICTTDNNRGVLNQLAENEGYECFFVPENIGGRYSVLTSAGLLPIAVAGINIDKLMEGAAKEAQRCMSKDSYNNPAVKYAAARHYIYKAMNKKVEMLACPSENVKPFAEWWKQLFGESDGKDKSGIFPASCVYTTDLHSIGQYIQDGERILFETFIGVKDSRDSMIVPFCEDDTDRLNYLAGRSFKEINTYSLQGVKQAHIKGGVPCIEISVPTKDEESLGALFYFFEMACGICGYMMGINPFDQPGVEEYKRNMFKLLGRD